MLKPRIVFVHDWLTGMRGGEKCLESLCKLFPDAKLYTLLHKKGALSPTIENLKPQTSWLGKLPGVHNYYRYLLPFMPSAIESIKIPDCDLVVSLSHCVAKGIIPPKGVPHLCYCFTPVRYAWHMRDDYFEAGEKLSIKKKLAAPVLNHIREWDKKTSERVTHFIAISKTIQSRISDCYSRESSVVYPPVDTEFYTPTNAQREDFYLVVSAFAPYKRIDLAIESCKALGKKLVIIGTGQDEKRLRSLAGPQTHFLGWQTDASIRDHMQRCSALLFPGFEDFGIVPVEAQACGTPVIALGKGGATETIIGRESSNEATGLFFAEPSVECMTNAIEEFDKEKNFYNSHASRKFALTFNQKNFEQGMLDQISKFVQSNATTKVAA
jgi:glycosyltransferase involved in cell wall biosynthesis